MAATTLMVMATATAKIGKGDDNNGENNNNGKDNEGGGGSIPDQHTTINYMRNCGSDGNGNVDGNSDENNDSKDNNEDNGKDDGVNGEDDNTTAIMTMMARITMAVAVACLPDMQQSTKCQ
jgi:hypothetical protein